MTWVLTVGLIGINCHTYQRIRIHGSILAKNGIKILSLRVSSMGPMSIVRKI